MPWCIFDIAGVEKEVSELEKKSAVPDFWNDQARAREIMLELAQKQKRVSEWRGLEKRVADLRELTSLLDSEDASLKDEITSEIEQVTNTLEKIEFQLTLGGKHDQRNAILSVHAGAGGTDSQDWAEMLVRMYMRWAERRGFRTEVLDSSPGEEAGIKSVTIAISGEYAFGYLKSERGVHRLVRLSPFDADHARHTSFALVEVMPEAENDVEVDIQSDDLKIESFRSSGPGGQHMQKTSSAVRITHLPSGIVVQCQNERSQFQNKEAALKIVRARLLNIKIAEQAKKQAEIKGDHVSAGWGNQIRSYVLHPYKMVKDHRTDYESSNPDAVLSGDLDDFINAYLKANMGDIND